MFMPLRRYADFSGRSRRMECGWFAVGVVAILALISFLFETFGPALTAMESEPGEVGSTFIVIYALLVMALTIPSIALMARRFHDQDKSGWHVLLGYVPVVGPFVVLFFMFLDGTRGPNRFGPDPKAEG